MKNINEKKELDKAYRKFRRNFKQSVSRIPSKDSFKAGYEYCKSLTVPPKPTKKYGYIIVNYNTNKEKYPENFVFVDKDNRECIIVSKNCWNYVEIDKDVRWQCEHYNYVMIYPTRKDARFDLNINQEDAEEDSTDKEVIWKVELDAGGRMACWLKKNP